MLDGVAVLIDCLLYTSGNFLEVFQARDYQILTAFKNSALITAASLLVLIFLGSMAGYVIQRRDDKVVKAANILIMIGLMLPPAILPTIKLLQLLHLYKSFISIVIMEAVMELPFTIMQMCIRDRYNACRTAWLEANRS